MNLDYFVRRLLENTNLWLIEDISYDDFAMRQRAIWNIVRVSGSEREVLAALREAYHNEDIVA